MLTHVRFNHQKLVPGQLGNGQSVYRVADAKTGEADENSAVLVKRQGDGWAPVEKLDAPVDRHQVQSQFGLWKDREVTEGFFRKKVVRPKDDQVQNDEVTDFQYEYSGPQQRGSELHQYAHVGAEITVDDSGAMLRDGTASYVSDICRDKLEEGPYGRAILVSVPRFPRRYMDLNRHARSVLYNDQHWNVSTR